MIRLFVGLVPVLVLAAGVGVWFAGSLGSLALGGLR